MNPKHTISRASYLIQCKCHIGMSFRCEPCNVLALLDKYQSLYNELEKWSKLEGHDKCWHHPEILKKLCDIANIPTSKIKLVTEKEFKQGCDTYRKTLYDRSPDY